MTNINLTDPNIIVSIVLILVAAIVLLVVWLLGQIKQLKSDLKDQLTVQSGQMSDLASDLSHTREKQLERLAEMQEKISERYGDLQHNIERRLGEAANHQGERFSRFSESTQNALHQHRQSFEERQLDALEVQQENLTQGMAEVRKQVTEALGRYGEDLGKRVEGLTQSTDQRLKEISGQVENFAG